MKKAGFVIHCHHDILVDYCYDYDERVEAIKRDKPQNEQEIRLRLFKMLPPEAIAELSERLKKAYAEREKAYAEWGKAYAEWEKAYAEREKAYAERRKADAEWRKADQIIWHTKWCGCKEWNGMEITFNK